MERMQVAESFRNVFKIEELRQRILFTLGMIFIFRLGVHVPLPGLEETAIQNLRRLGEEFGSLIAFLNIFSGGGFDNIAIFGLGIMPYITASIIMQLMTKVNPRLEEIVKEGPAGQRRIAVWTRLLTIPIAIVQAFMGLRALNGVLNMSLYPQGAVLPFIAGVFALVAGAIFVMWLGEQISEYGLGNGASILIMVGIVGRIPDIYRHMFLQVGRPAAGGITMGDIVVITAIYVVSIVAIVFMTQAQRRIPIQHAKHFRGRRIALPGGRNYLPLRVIGAGVMPLIFASALLVVPQALAQIPGLHWIGTALFSGRFLFTVLYTGMIFFFAYFWTYLFFEPNEIAKNLKEYGSFIPGIRPGEQTAHHLDEALRHIVFIGAAFLSVIALVPEITSTALGTQRFLVGFLGGTGILIVVGVNLDVLQKIESHLLMHHYRGFTGTSALLRGRR
jgi:preprotein translocase subunit SecY